MIQNQFGNILYVPDIGGTDLSTATEITVTLTRPHQITVWTLTGGDIAVGVVDLIDGTTTYPAGTYVQRTFQDGDITQYGDYKVTMSALLLSGVFCPSTTNCFDVDPEVGACSC